jgi:anti-sigma factor RsiW
VNEPVTEADLQAYVDGRLDPARRALVDSWLAARPEEAERVAAYRRLSGEVRAAYQAMLDEPPPARIARVGTHPRAFARQAALAAVWIVLGVAIGAVATLELKGARPGASIFANESAVMARRAAIAHATYSPEVRHPVEVAASEEQHLVAWLSKRLGVKVKAPRLDDVGMSLVGGRLLPGDAGPVAQFMYEMPNGRRLTLYVRQERAHNAETAFRYARENNVGVFYWIDRECGYAIASSDLNRDELLKVAELVYQQLEP